MRGGRWSPATCRRPPDIPQQAMLRQITGELAKDIKTEADLNKILNQFVKMTVEAALGAEMEHTLVC